MLISGIILQITLCMHLILNSAAARFLVPGVFGVFWDLWLFLSSFSAILFGDVIALKKERFTENLCVLVYRDAC